MSRNRPTDDFLCHVFPGDSSASVRFREEIETLNLYCHRYKGAIGCILITGASGVGKNYTARAISAHSQWLTLTDDERRQLYYDKTTGTITLPPVTLIDRLLFKEHLVKRSSVPQRVLRLATVLGPQLVDDLADSELFGHKKHSFTGAEHDHPGIFGDSAVDDVLLDEIGDLSPKVQAKLLQFIETRTFRPVGGVSADECTSEHRLFLATNRSLEERVQSGLFREDLYWRIQGYQITIPPLRQRKDTIRQLAHSILRSVNQRHRGDEQIGPSLDLIADRYCLLPQTQWIESKPQRSNWVIRLEEEDLEWCESHDWPGNVRELRHRLELYVFRNGHSRLRNILPDPPAPRPPTTEMLTGLSVAPVQLVVAAVHDYLIKVLDGREPSPRQPKALLAHFQQMVKSAVYEFKSNRRLSKRELAAIFPDAKDAETTVGRWRTGTEIEDSS